MNSSTLSTGDLISLGKTTYRQKKYDVARDYFKVALTRSDAPTLDLLDHLAAVSDKLENLTESLRYGRQMIHLDDTSSRGYLRVGRTLHNSKNPIFVAKELALYDRAIEKVKTSDSNLKYLKSLRDGLYREQCPPNSIDPFSVLPVELAHQILEDLDFNDRISCLRVRKEWNTFLAQQPHLWTTIDLRNKRQKKAVITPRFVKKCVKFSSYTVHTIHLGSFGHLDCTKAVLKSCKKLTTLSFGANSPFGATSMLELLPLMRAIRPLRSLSIGMVLPNSLITEILAQGPDFERLELLGADHEPIFPNRLRPVSSALHWPQTKRYMNLKVFHLAGHNNLHEIDSSKFNDQFLAQANNLESLTLEACYFTGNLRFNLCSKIKHLSFSLCQLREPLFPRSLTVLRLHKNGVSIDRPQLLPNLEELSVTGGHNEVYIANLLSTHKELSDAQLGLLLESSPLPTKYSKLKSYKLGGIGWDNSDPRTVLTQQTPTSLANPRLSDLETLTVMQNPRFTDQHVESIANTFICLKSVRFSDIPITGASIKILVLKQEKLEWLVLENCSEVSEDTLGWANGRGVKTLRQFSAVAANSSRRIAGGAF